MLKPSPDGKKYSWFLCASVCFTATTLLYALTWLYSLEIVMGISNPVFSFCVQFLTMGWAVVVIDIWKPGLQYSWFDSKQFEKEGRIYRQFGIIIFQWALRRIGWESTIRGRNRKFTPASAFEYEYGSRFGEFAHFLGIAALLPILTWMIIKGERNAIFYLTFWAILLHGYPIMLQRYNRPRYKRIADWYEKMKIQL